MSQAFQSITPILTANGLIDATLSKTQRKTPTEVHPQFQITRIRSFYMRKVKFAETAFTDKLNTILNEFPKIDDLHPFYADLCNVLYDKDHYKLALGQVKTVIGTIESVSKDYNKLLKFADSLYKCKMLKRAALGRMATAVKRLAASLQYLEEVRQHLTRLPSIQPSARTLILTGYPNVGKSSFMNLLTDANVEVQPYAFTTKSVYVGHTDYAYTRWQVLDTPGLLDSPLETKNTVEMTAITALAHIHATVLFFVDVSELCGWSVEEQLKLFNNIKPLFRGKPVLLVLNKVDLVDAEKVEVAKKLVVDTLGAETTEGILQASCATLEGVDAVKNTACELLLKLRVEKKLAAHNNKLEAALNRMHIATPKTNTVERPAYLPPSLQRQEEQTTEADLMARHGGAGVYSVDYRKRWQLAEAEWKYDVLPEVMDGHNVLDFIDPEIDAKLAALEAEEEALRWGDVDDEAEAATWKEAQQQLGQIHHAVEQTRLENRLKKGKVPNFSRQLVKKASELVEALPEGADVEGVLEKSKKSRKRLREHVEDEEQDEVPDRVKMAMPGAELRAVAAVKKRKTEKMRNREGRQGDADRFIDVKKPKHLFSGKRGSGTTDWR